MKTKLIVLTILTLLAVTPLTYARGGRSFGGGHRFGGAHFGGFRGSHSFHGGNRGFYGGGHRFHGGGNRFYGGGNRFYGGGNRFYGGGNRFHAGGNQRYGKGRGHYGHRRNWGGHYRRHGDWGRHHQRHNRRHYYYYDYSNSWWPWLYGSYVGDFYYPYDSYVYYDDSDDEYDRRRHRKYHGRSDQSARRYETPRVQHRQRSASTRRSDIRSSSR